MCGRYGRYSRKERLEEVLGFTVDGDFDPGARYNICPGRPDWALRQFPESQRPRFDLLDWGLPPSWAKSKTATRRPINARADTVAEKPMFRDLLRQRRCAVPADGYYEWRTTSAGKVPFWFHLKSQEPFFFAGLWDTWHAGKPDAVSSYILMTTEPNELAATVHDRMPVLLHARDVQLWLDPTVKDPGAVTPLLRSYPAAEMVAHPVSRGVSDPNNEGPDLIQIDDSVRELWG
jgi:putative SOS response-associated peptidase YedK